MTRLFSRRLLAFQPGTPGARLRGYFWFCIVCWLLLGISSAFASDLFFFSPDGYLRRTADAGAREPVGAVQALGREAFLDANGQLLCSAIPAGTRVVGFEQQEAGATLEFSTEVLGLGLDEERLSRIAEQVRATLSQFEIWGTIRLQTGGRLLSDYLPPKPLITPRSTPAEFEGITPKTAQAAGSAGALAGKSISLSPGHGKVWTGSSYTFERPVYCSPLACEDDHNVEIMTYLNQYLTQDGAVTKVYRCLDKAYGTHTPSGMPWWRVSAGYWLQLLGYPCSVYASYTGDCALGTGLSEASDSLRSRGLASDYDATDIYVSLHSNGYQGDCTNTTCPNGTCTYYDTSTEHAAWGAISQTLATKVNSAIISAIRTKYTDSTWTDRGAIDAAGSQAETRIPDRAAILIELAFHDSCLRDAVYLRDNFFRSTTMWAVYKGICDYFGTTPGWDYYSYELVSDDIPPVLKPGVSTAVHITLRNRGVLWNDAKQFRLGAVGDSDPFSTVTRYNVGGEVGPGQTKTFTINLTAPATEGLYATDWRMVREGVTWFGPALTRNILVSTSGDTQAPSTPVGLAATAPVFNEVDLRWQSATDNVAVTSYRIYRNNVLLGSTDSTNYSDLGCESLTSYSYQVSAMDASTNESLRSGVVRVTTPAQLDFILDNLDGVASGTWQTGTTSADKYAADYRFLSTATSQTGYFRWTPVIEQPGFYNVFAWYSQGSNRCTNSPYRLNYAGGAVVVPVDQTTGGGAWRSLGISRPFIRGTNGWVQLGNGTSEPAKVVLADAVRFTYASALPALPPLQQALSGTRLTLTWSNGYAMLQKASSLTGSPSDWQDVPGATSPYVIDTAAAPAMYYRLRY